MKDLLDLHLSLWSGGYLVRRLMGWVSPAFLQRGVIIYVVVGMISSIHRSLNQSYTTVAWTCSQTCNYAGLTWTWTDTLRNWLVQGDNCAGRPNGKKKALENASERCLKTISWTWSFENKFRKIYTSNISFERFILQIITNQIVVTASYQHTVPLWSGLIDWNLSGVFAWLDRSWQRPLSSFILKSWLWSPVVKYIVWKVSSINVSMEG